ncbi:BTAD domain-containing putative transcriptional regulator [Actinoplanes sp. NPDC023714]|uniref:AfsR/SARP family transcriptional regulator n=1 Tax=Actinoplanes sp. NPDC023714 TaxID=3154322 RepID=UPI00340892FA
MGIRVGVLGPVELVRDGRVIPLTGAPQRVLLARLALAGGRPVPVADLIDALWEAGPPDNAVGNLHSYVSRLRRQAGSEVICREPGGYRLNLSGGDGGTDVEIVERLVRRARDQRSDPAAVTLAEALAVWRGESLADVADRMVFAPDVARLNEWRRHLHEECLERRLDAGRAAETLPEIEALATAQPLRERPRLLLMRALHATGRTPEALTVVRTYRERLAEDHGLDPSPALVELQRRILAEDPALRPPMPAGRAPETPARISTPSGDISDMSPEDGPARDAPAAGWEAGKAPAAGWEAGKAPAAGWEAGKAPATGREAGKAPAAGRWVNGTEGTAGPGGKSIPRRADRFFGRTAELSALRHALAADRVVSLVGPGGVGKTRLMTEALTGGELLVELAERSVPSDVAAAVAGALGLRAAPRGGIAALAERLGSAPAVLVLDNCEHLLEAVRDLVAALVIRCPGVRVLATSRQRLGVAGERVLRVGPLPASDRVALFCDRAALLRADFRDDIRTRELAAEICELVDGLPLAVELAARREAVFGLAHLRDRLGAGLNVLDPARGGDRSTAVSATVEWSYRLLDPAAQRLLDHLAVCRGGFGLDALPYFDQSRDAESLLAELADASLVTCDLSAGQPRYRLLETVRHVSLGHLDPAGERQARDAHARWMLDLAAELVRRGRDRDPWTTPTLRREVGNLQEALSWLARGDRDGGARLAALLAVINSDAPDPGLTDQLASWKPDRIETESDMLCGLAAGNAEWLRGDLAEADRILTAVLDRMPGDHPLRWGALIVRISNGMFAGRAASVRADAELMAADPGAPHWARATGICCAALMDAYAGDPGAGLAWLDEYAGELDTERYDGFVPFTRGELLAASAPEEALAWYDRSIAASDRANLIYTSNVARVARAAVLIRLGRRQQAADACREAITAVRDVNMTAQLWTILRLTAELLDASGESETAAVIVRAADADPLAPAVMGPDVERLARLRDAVPAPPPPPGAGDAAAICGYALTALLTTYPIEGL